MSRFKEIEKDNHLAYINPDDISAITIGEDSFKCELDIWLRGNSESLYHYYDTRDEAIKVARYLMGDRAPTKEDDSD